jgi:hypothetical protein
MVELLKTDESSELELLGTLPDGSDFSLRVPLKAVPRAQVRTIPVNAVEVALHVALLVPPGSPSMMMLAGLQGEAYAVLHGLAWVSSLMAGTSPLHVGQDGEQVPSQPSPAAVKEAVVRAACAEHLITRYTAAVGVLLQADPLDPYAVK